MIQNRQMDRERQLDADRYLVILCRQINKGRYKIDIDMEKQLDTDR